MSVSEDSVTSAGKIIFIDDDKDLMRAQVQGLELSGFEVEAFSNGPEALVRITPEFRGVVMSDVRMPQMDGLTVFRRIQDIDADIPVILLTGHGDVQMAVQAMKDGVYDFITKPFAMDELILSLRRAVQKRMLVIENRQLRQLHSVEAPAQAALLGTSPLVVHLRQTVAQVAEAGIDILVTGDTGTGKELVARTLHRSSARRSRSFVAINCAALREDSFDADMFGIEPGVKSGPYGAVGRRIAGRFEKAHRGTLFLDDVDGLSLGQQAKVLRMAESGEIWPVGAEESRSLDLRIIAATRTDLSELVRNGQFRADLYYRLSGVTLRIPPLGQRPGDITLLFQHFLVQASVRLKRPIPRLTLSVLAYIQSHDWPSNVRELEHFAERIALGLDVAEAVPQGEAPAAGLIDRLAQYEADLIRKALSARKGSAKEAMEDLQLARKTFYDKLNRHNISIRDYR